MIQKEVMEKVAEKTGTTVEPDGPVFIYKLDGKRVCTVQASKYDDEASLLAYVQNAVAHARGQEE